MTAGVRSCSMTASIFRLVSLMAVIMLALCLAGCDDEESSSASGATPASGTPQATGMLEESARAPRVINIVYDDSGSMNGDNAWCHAHYAIEVFAAMLDENDIMNVFTMSNADINKTAPALTVKGSETISDRVKKAHEVFSLMDSWTNFGAARSAYQDFANPSYPKNAEKWLVVLTDGAFTHYDETDPGYANQHDTAEISQLIQRDFEQWASEGIHVEYVGMREDAVLFNPAMNLSTRCIVPDKILETIIEESNKVFGRAVLPQDRHNGKQLTLDIPMKKIIVFAQGDGVSVGNLSVPADKTQSANVRYAERSNLNVNPVDGLVSTNFDTNLQGVVKVFEGKFKSGTVELPVSNDKKTEIYYEPFVDIHMAMNAADGSQVVLSQGTKAELKPGSYTATFSLHDPFTGEVISSNLITSETYETVLKYADGSEIAVPEGNAIQIDEGEAQIIGRAVINGEVPYSQNYQVDIISRSMGIEILSKPAEPVDVHVLDSSDPIVVRVNNQGKPLSADEMQNTTLEVTTSLASEPQGLLGWLFGTPSGLDYTVEPTAEPGVFNIYLQTHNGEPAETVDGDVPLHIRATRDAGFGGYTSLGETDTTLKIAGVSFLERLLHWLLTHLLQLLLLILLALLIAFIVMQVRKPRIPRNLAPRIIGIENEDELSLTYSRKNVKHAIWPPWAPETSYFKMTVKGDATDAYELTRRFQLGGRKIGIVAVKTKRGNAAVKLSESAIAAMKQQLDAYDAGTVATTFPHPGYDNFESMFTHGGGGFTIQGLKPHRRRGWGRPEDTTYEVTF